MPGWGLKPRGFGGADDSGFAPSMFAPAGGPALIPAARVGRERLRTFRVLAGARLVMAVMLLGWLLLLRVLSQSSQHEPALAGWVAAAYVVLTAAALWWSLTRESDLAWQVLMAIVVDLAAFGILQFIAAFPNREFVLIYALPVLAAGIYGTLSLTLLVAAIVALLLLGDATLAMLRGRLEVETQLLNAGFVGAAYFAVGVLAWQLSQRLARQEARARTSELRARRQMLINQRMIEEQREGIVVVDERYQVEALNPTAQRLLQLPWSDAVSPRGGIGRRSIRELPEARAVLRELDAMHMDAQDMREATVQSVSGVRLRLRVSVLRDMPGGAAYLVALQDLRDVDARIQQEKLAAMGRLVASVAHEIRNPLGAIAQANALAGEHSEDAAQVVRLRQIVAQNAERINRTVEDILELGRQGEREVADAPSAGLLREIVAEFARTSPERIALEIEDDHALLRFDPLHLRRVLVNLLSNSVRYASQSPGAIVVRQTGVGRVREITVGNDGPVIDAELREQLFEPFRTTSNRGVGLGLYISLELCARNHARLAYRVEQQDAPSARGHFALIVNPPTAA